MKGIYRGTELVVVGGLVIATAMFVQLPFVRYVGVLIVAFGAYSLTKLKKY